MPKMSVIVNEEDFARSKREDPRSYQMRIEIDAKGKIFREKMPHLKGSTFGPEELRNTDEELIRKFADNASRILPIEKAKQAAESLLEMEKYEKVIELVGLIRP